MAEETQDIQQQDPPAKLGVKEFAAKIKSKYPDYAGIDDSTLVQKIITKYPEYKEQIDFTEKKILYRLLRLLLPLLRLRKVNPFPQPNLHQRYNLLTLPLSCGNQGRQQ